MIVVSNDFKTAMKQPIKELDAYITEDNNNIRSENDLISFKISCDTGMCKSAMRKLEAKYIGEHNLLGKWVQAGFGVKLPSGAVEYLDYGSFLITEITTVKDTGITTVVGYDKMVSSMREYSKLEVEYPMSLLDYTKLLCNACNLELGNNIFGTNLFNLKNVTSNVIVNSIINTSFTYSNLWFKPIMSNKYLLKMLKPATKYTVSAKVTLLEKPSEITTWEQKRLISISKSNGSGMVDLIFTDNTEIKNNWGINETKVFNHTFTTPNDLTDYGLWAYNYGNGGSFKFEEMIISLAEENNRHRPYNEMNDYPITQELWENVDGITYRDILVQIAQATGSTCIIGNDDKVYFKPLNNTGEQLTYDNMKKLKLEPVYGEINSIVLSRTPQEDNVYMRDEESVELNGLTEYKIENNEIIDKDRDSAMTPIYNALHGISYYPFETTTEGLGWFEIGDSFDIVNDTGDVFNTSLFNFNITIDGGIKEILKTVAETKTQTQYQYATTIAKRVKNTEIIVDKQGQNINQLVTDMYEEDGVINENFTKVYQDINNIIHSVQNSGGSNLIKNSVMFSYDDNNIPTNWEVEGDGTLSIQSSAEALANGSLSGHTFTLLDKIVRQRIQVKAHSESDVNKFYYTFSTKIKKDTTGTCYVKLYNSNEEYIIELSAGESAFYEEYEIKALLPKDNYYDVEFYGSADSNATFTDTMLSIGEYKTQWQQANGEVMNTQVNINLDGVLIKSSVYLGDYTVMSPLEFAGYSKINGTITKVFSLNKDTTLVKKLEAEDEFKMVPIKVVPVPTGDLQGWAFVPST